MDPVKYKVATMVQRQVAMLAGTIIMHFGEEHVIAQVQNLSNLETSIKVKPKGGQRPRYFAVKMRELL